MRLFSTGKAKKNKVAKGGKRVLIVTGVMLALFMAAPVVGSGNNMFSMNAYAAEYNWQQEGEIWRLKDAAGNNVSSTWYQDATGARYYLDSNGVMKTGVLNRDGHYYYLDSSGKMVVADGVYNGVNLTFNQDVNSTTYGEITSGAQELMNAGTTSTSVGTTQQQSTTKKGSIFPDNPYPYQEVTLSNGYVSYWDPTFNMWMHKSGEMTKGAERSSSWDADAQALAEQVGRAMAEQNR